MYDERYNFLNDRIDHVDSRIDDMDVRVTSLEADKELKKSRAMEWLVVILIVIEIVEAYFMWRH